MYTLMSWERKIRRAHAKLFTYLRVLLGTICDRLSINCSFEGKHVSSMEVNWRNALPCLIVFRRSCHLKFCFCTREGRQFAVLFSTSEERPTPHRARITVGLTGLFPAPKLHISNYAPPTSHDPLLFPRLLACEHLIWIEEPPLPLVYSQHPLCSVKLWQRQFHTGSRGAEQAAAAAARGTVHTPVGRLWVTSLRNYRSIYRSGCLIAEAQLNHWADLFLLYFAQLWFDMTKWCLREEDWPKLQLGILFAPVFVLSFDWTLSWETSSEVFAVLMPYSIATWRLLQHGNEIRTRLIVYPLWHHWKESTLRTTAPPLKSSRRPVYLILWPLYTAKRAFRFLLRSVVVILVWRQMQCSEPGRTSLEKHCRLEDHGGLLPSSRGLPDKPRSCTADTQDRAGVSIPLL